MERDEGDDGDAFIRLCRSQDFTNELNQHFNRFDSLHTIRSKPANMWKVHNKAFVLAGGCKQKVKYTNVIIFFLQIRSEFRHEFPRTAAVDFEHSSAVNLAAAASESLCECVSAGRSSTSCWPQVQ